MFLGASYFRALGAGPALRPVGARPRDRHRRRAGRGVSALHRVLDRASPRPTRRTLTIYALLDSPRASGAYQFDVHPGDETVIDVRARIFLRAERRDARHRAAHQHVLLRREPAASHGLPPRGARLRRPDGRHRRRRMDLAAAAQSEADADHVVLDARAARLRPDAAGPRISTATRTARRATSCGRAPGSSRSGLGRRVASSWCS